ARSSASESVPCSATFALTVPTCPYRASTDSTSSAGQAGNVALTATVWGSSSAALPAVGRLALPAVGRLARSPGGRPANSRAARSHLLASSVPYSVNGENSAHPSG